MSETENMQGDISPNIQDVLLNNIQRSIQSDAGVIKITVLKQRDKQHCDIPFYFSLADMEEDTHMSGLEINIREGGEVEYHYEDTTYIIGHIPGYTSNDPEVSARAKLAGNRLTNLAMNPNTNISKILETLESESSAICRLLSSDTTRGRLTEVMKHIDKVSDLLVECKSMVSLPNPYDHLYKQADIIIMAKEGLVYQVLKDEGQVLGNTCMLKHQLRGFLESKEHRILVIDNEENNYKVLATNFLVKGGY